MRYGPEPVHEAQAIVDALVSILAARRNGCGVCFRCKAELEAAIVICR